MNEKKIEKNLRKSFFKKNKASFIAAVALFALMACAMPVVSWGLGEVLDIITSGDMSALVRIAVLIAIFVPVYVIIRSLGGLFVARFVHKGIRQYKESLFDSLSRKSIGSFYAEKTGVYLSALTNDCTTIEKKYLYNSVAGVLLIGEFILSLGMMVWYSWRMTLVVLGLTLLPIIVTVIMGGGLAKRERKVSDMNDRFTSRVKDLFSGFSVIKSFRAENQAAQLFCSENTDAESSKQKRDFYEGLVGAFSNGAGSCLQFGIFLVGAVLAMRGEITVGTVVIFVNLCNAVIDPVSNLPELFAGRKAAKALIKKHAAFLAEEEAGTEVKALGSFDSAISFDNVTFGYEEDKPVLRGLSCTFEKGRSYAVVGGSGTGKSTLLHLLTGELRGYTGSLTVDGSEVSGLSADSLYGVISLIDQNVFLFDDTIRSNITMFASFPDEQVDRAIRLSGLEEVIAERGEDYLCGENGSELSGGERQRVSIARSVLRGAEILLVDEATSALDNITARKVSDALLGIEDMTKIVVTHRMDGELLSKYDSIVMLKNGTVCEQGGFDELMEKKGQFYSLYNVSEE